MLELRSADGAFERVESWLRERGFFGAGGESLCADLFLGYGLSAPLRRRAAAAPAEPCAALPLLACSVRDDRYVVEDANADRFPRTPRIGRWIRSWAPASYAAAIGAVREAIGRGDVYQVNLVQHLSAPFAGDARSLAAALRTVAPNNLEPLCGDGWAVVSASPELFLSRRGRRIRTMPIKGTRPPGGADDLRSSPKDAAEHVMIVDLERNDLSRVCEPGSVGWSSLMTSRRLAGVEHLVSTVEGTLRENVGLAELLTATFPGGSVTGAPKIAAIDHIAALEPVGRGAAMGALGRVWGNGDLELALTIRTFALADGLIHLWVGGGVVWDSDPESEVEESLVKARPLLEAIGASLPEPAIR